MPQYPNPLFEQLFVEPESAYSIPTDMGDGQALRHLRAAFTYAQERAARDDHHGTRGVRERVSRRKTLAYEIDTYVCPSGTAGTAPDIAGLLTAHGLDSRTTSSAVVTVSPAATTTSAGITPADAILAGDAAAFAVGGELHVRLVTSNNAGVLQWGTPLPSVPAAGAPVSRSVCYRPSHSPERSVSIRRFLDAFSFSYPGCVGEGWELTFSGGAEARLRLTGKGMTEIFCGRATLAGNIDNLATVVPITDAAVFDVGAVTAVGDELMSVAASHRAGNTLTVTRGYRGTSAVSHSAGDEISSRQPEALTHGSPIAGVVGRVHLRGGLFHITQASVQFKDGLRMRETFGSDTASGFSYPDRRRVRLSLEGFLTDESAAEHARARLFENLTVDLQAGVAAGRTVSVHIPRFEADVPEITALPGREIPLGLTGPCLETDGDDEVFLVFA